MSEQVLQKAEEFQKKPSEDPGDKTSNQFMGESNASVFFQFDWSGLLRAAPSALSTVGLCCIAASLPMAEQISMKNSMPMKGFAYLTDDPNPSLKGCLVDGKFESC